MAVRKTVQPALKRRIDLANKYIDFAKKNDVRGWDYAGSTFPTVIIEYFPIFVNNQFVKVAYDEGGMFGQHFRERYNVNHESMISDLKFEINLIIRSIKKGAKDEGIKVPEYK